MSERRTVDEVTRLLNDADRDLAKGDESISDFCRKVGVVQTTCYRWRERHDPEQVDANRRRRQPEVERLKRLVAPRRGRTGSGAWPRPRRPRRVRPDRARGHGDG